MSGVNHEVKGTLAKLLATENLIIEHKKVPTACFDVQRRVLTLPIWDKASGVVYDLLVGHEVGHALYTPNEDWTQVINVPKDYVNVVEDARIEKLMKRKFPGLARTFYNGYSELNKDDFFSIADENLNQFTLIDRINLHFKIGAYAQIPFNENEQQFIEMIESAETFQQVLTICELIHNYVKEKKQEELNINVLSNENQLGSGNSAGQSAQQMNVDQQMNTGEESITDSVDSSEKKQSDNSNNSDNSPEQKISDGSGGGGPTEQQSEEVSKTQKSFDEQTKKLTNTFTSETFYIERPELKIDEVIADYKIIKDYVSNHFKGYNQTVSECFQRVDADYHKYRIKAQKEVNYLVKEFEMKKSADSYQRMTTARTGTLDTTKLHTYKYNEDLFRKVSVIPDGKNHGLIFMLDWSGSMNDYLLDTVKQLLNLVWFCKKVQIPFEVYAFTYEWSNSYIDSSYSSPKSLYKKQESIIDVHHRFRLLNFISSRCNNKVLDECILNLWRLAAREDSSYIGATGYDYHVPNGLHLSGTPLNESIIALHQIIPQFKSQNKLQKVNVVILTDGEGNHLNFNLDIRRGSRDVLGQNYINNNNALRDRKIGHVYRNFVINNIKNNLPTILLENLKDNFPEVNLIGFRICSGSTFSYLYRSIYEIIGGVEPENAMKVWRKEKTYEINSIGYDALYMISSHDLSVDSDMTVDEEATTIDIGRAFRTMLKKKSTNKKLLSSFVNLVA